MKEDFRKYLDRKGVMDALTKAFVLCYDERPENPIDRLVEVVAECAKMNPNLMDLRTRLLTTEEELKHAQREVEILRKQLMALGVTPEVIVKPEISEPIASTSQAQASAAGSSSSGNAGDVPAATTAEVVKTEPAQSTGKKLILMF